MQGPSTLEIRLGRAVFPDSSRLIPDKYKYGYTEGYFCSFGDIAKGCYYIA